MPENCRRGTWLRGQDHLSSMSNFVLSMRLRGGVGGQWLERGSWVPTGIYNIIVQKMLRLGRKRRV